MNEPTRTNAGTHCRSFAPTRTHERELLKLNPPSLISHIPSSFSLSSILIHTHKHTHTHTYTKLSIYLTRIPHTILILYLHLHFSPYLFEYACTILPHYFKCIVELCYLNYILLFYITLRALLQKQLILFSIYKNYLFLVYNYLVNI